MILIDKKYKVKTDWHDFTYAEFMPVSIWVSEQPEELKGLVKRLLESKEPIMIDQDQLDFIKEFICKISDVPFEFFDRVMVNDVVAILSSAMNMVYSLVTGLFVGHNILPVIAIASLGEVFKIKTSDEFWQQFRPLPDMSIKQMAEINAFIDQANKDTKELAIEANNVRSGKLTSLPIIAAILVSDYNDKERIGRLAKEFEQQPMDILIDVFFYSLVLRDSLPKLLKIYSPVIERV